MSGSNSSARADSSNVEPVVMAVHGMDTPVLADERRTSIGRVKMLLVLLVCAAPVIASYFTYYVLRPEGRTNYGTLILPTRALPAALPLRSLDGAAVPAASIKGNWMLVVVAPGACGELCEKQLFMQRQLREMLGKERARLDKVWFITDDMPLTPALQQAVGGAVPVQALRVQREALAAWLAPEAGQALEAHLYVVDPLGEWMMRFPANAEPRRVKRDLDRLLRASSFWHKPER
jgi:hypothetical protein